MTQKEFEHIPVMLGECMDMLAVRADGIYIDGTVGGAGHSLEIARRLHGGRLYCLDKDPDAVAAATARLNGLPAQVINGDFRDVQNLLPGVRADGALLDLGVSSHQLDCAERGFSYHDDAPLDMRMSQSGTTAADIVNNYDIGELCRVFRDYGDEPHAYEIAKKIVREREQAPITTTLQLAQTVSAALPPAVRRKEKHPARRVFQAVRIEVNDEMGALSAGLESLLNMLVPGGRLCVLTFHSIEDRMVKTAFADFCRGCICPPEFPVCVCGRVPRARQVTRKPLSASEQELAVNSRSHSAKLRVIERTNTQ